MGHRLVVAGGVACVVGVSALGMGCKETKTVIVVATPTIEITPTLSAEQLDYIQSVATQKARPTETPVPPTSTPAPPPPLPLATQPPPPPTVPPSAPPPTAAPSPPPAPQPLARVYAVTVIIDGTPGLLFNGGAQAADPVGFRSLEGVTPMTYTEANVPLGTSYAVIISKGDALLRGSDAPGTLSLTLRCPDGDHAESTSTDDALIVTCLY